eukprot:CAMPEP_0113941896 /NCGR_PEP_ID=MMETSP1339-20121228/7726_1 /TAXON_ID=94617 /ORGANISM="Fibrocapsa japonica" /LENGTH=335 /DNA_ID=CAMNT_0000946179 /DNA_START=206 /DNA_END=1213 /DNA_ORIENTATION=+ /assembly_acc=CAM_ASM_000762
MACSPDLICFDFKARRCIKIKCAGEKPSGRASFAMCKGPDKGTLILAGGTGDDGLPRGDIWEYNSLSRKWNRLFLSDGGLASTFCRLYGQSVCCYGRSLIFFGGSSGKCYSNEVFKFDVDTLQYEQLKTKGTAPYARYKHQANIVGNKMFIFGGGNYLPSTKNIDVFCLDFETLRWNKVNALGQEPQARVAHTTVMDEISNKIYLWGGFNTSLNRLQDFFCFDIITSTWTALHCNKTSSYCPSPRAFHASCIYGDGIFIFGGANEENRYSDVWKYLVRHNPPSLMVLATRATLSTSGACQNKCLGKMPIEVFSTDTDLNLGSEGFISPVKKLIGI